MGNPHVRYAKKGKCEQHDLLVQEKTRLLEDYVKASSIREQTKGLLPATGQPTGLDIKVKGLGEKYQALNTRLIDCEKCSQSGKCKTV